MTGAILFGGDQLDQTVADTWTFDGTQGTQQKPWRRLREPAMP